MNKCIICKNYPFCARRDYGFGCAHYLPMDTTPIVDYNTISTVNVTIPRVISTSLLKKAFEIKKVIFNNPATVALWADGSKTVVKCGKNDDYDPEKGLAMCFAKKALGNCGHYYETFKKYLSDEDYFDILFADDQPVIWAEKFPFDKINKKKGLDKH